MNINENEQTPVQSGTTVQRKAAQPEAPQARMGGFVGGPWGGVGWLEVFYSDDDADMHTWASIDTYFRSSRGPPSNPPLHKRLQYRRRCITALWQYTLNRKIYRDVWTPVIQLQRTPVLSGIYFIKDGSFIWLPKCKNFRLSVYLCTSIQPPG